MVITFEKYVTDDLQFILVFPRHNVFCVYHDMKNCNKLLLWGNSSTCAQNEMHKKFSCILLVMTKMEIA